MLVHAPPLGPAWLVQIQATESYHRLQLLLQGLQQVLPVQHRERTEGHWDWAPGVRRKYGRNSKRFR